MGLCKFCLDLAKRKMKAKRFTLNWRFRIGVAIAVLAALCNSALGASLEDLLIEEGPKSIAAAAKRTGDANRGAIVFYQNYMTCTKCHVSQNGKPQLGPQLSELGEQTAPEKIVESVLQPSKEIKKEYRAISLITEDGKSLAGLYLSHNENELRYRDPSNGQTITLPLSDIEEWGFSETSIMPQGLVNQLSSRQQFLDLCRYLFVIAEGGAEVEKELRPAPSMYASRVPEYEKEIDHAGMIADLNDDAFARGEAIYNRLCINCHGTNDRPGSLPTSLKFGKDKFKNGSDPYSMYQTLTKGFGMMVAQGWMVPQQKYDVIHYVRETYLKPHNKSQYTTIDDSYLAGLPQGDSRGPAPSNIVEWSRMDYGPSLINTYEIGKDGKNFAYKGIAVRLDSGGGGVSRGNRFVIFDHDTMRLAAAWSGEGFINWEGIHFDGRHGAHPRIVGQVEFQNPTGPGWARPGSKNLKDDRLVGRDDRRYGPLDRSWAHYKGLYRFQDRSIISYTVGNTAILETPSFDDFDALSIFSRTFHVEARDKDLTLQIAQESQDATILSDHRSANLVSAIEFGVRRDEVSQTSHKNEAFAFDGNTRLVVEQPQDFNLTSKDYTIALRFKTKSDGSLFSKCAKNGKWVPNGVSLFIRGGRLVLDVGWVGDVTSRRRVADGKWHDAVLSWSAESGQVRMFIDGKPGGRGRLRPEAAVPNAAVHIGYTSTDFPTDDSLFDGEISELSFYQRTLSKREISDATLRDNNMLVAKWSPQTTDDALILDQTDNDHSAIVVRGKQKTVNPNDGPLGLAVTGDIDDLKWHAQNGRILLTIPAGQQTRRIQLRHARLNGAADLGNLVAAAESNPRPVEILPMLAGGTRRYPEVLKTQPIIAADEGPFAVDFLTHPSENPWFCRTRLTGIDFYPDGDQAAVTSWDGNVWLVSGLNHPKNGLYWRRIADGLFQPLGVRIVDDAIHVTCRDQLVILRDLNNDGETDFYESFNNDHQVTEHFHEFAMGLQTDDHGNFYYAKSARHAKKALVPHHGTLLRISKDGKKTDILARGFRAANGVCLNKDGTFIVTDQEGHWNPKNRINWVSEGGFYGNMWGYHDVTDTSDSAMEQPLCWITNAFDRSPSELLWVDSEQWGPLNGSLLNMSYGYGKVYVVPHETVKGQVQGGMCAFPIEKFPTGVMRGRFHPVNGQLYCCGMFAWAGSQHQPGGLYRIRYTGKPVHLPIELNASQSGIRIGFSGEVDVESACKPENYAVKIWGLKRTANYGSKHYDERRLSIEQVDVSKDRKSVLLRIPKLETTWCMEIKYDIRGSNGERVSNTIHNTIHNLSDES